MLREMRHVRQHPGEPKRRWFFSHVLDLVAWEDETGTLCAFQLAYSKYGGEHSLYWHRQEGFRHYVVDDGESSALKHATPLMYLDGPFPRDTVLADFQAEAGELPAGIARFVEEKLRQFAQEESSGQANSGEAAPARPSPKP